ncbi:phage tail spike protein [Staphylococcus simulans]|uniref:phage tail spike protein n=1 Tax=Staphylococcus simulans TaxID=1286 RepID=UPI003BABAE9C
MLHVLDFEGNIIDFISDKDNYLENALMVKDKTETLETFEFDIDSDRAENMRERNRIIVQDSNGQYREFIIVRIEDDLEDRTFVECNASYLEDINTAKPLAPGKYEAMTTSQALKEVLKDTGWQMSEATEYGGARTTTWTAYHTPYEVLKQLSTTYDMEIDFYIELGANKVKGRYVEMHKPKPLFKGKEITYGKDLTGMSKTVDISELHTALMALGPEDENGNREVLTVVDNTAHQQFGLPNRYIWGIYEPQSEDTNMTAQRLKTLATTQLNKDKQAAVSYEVTAADISQQFPHEKTAIGDVVRVKDREFNPPLYIEAEVIREEYNPIKKESTYTFGNIVEYIESTLRKDFMNRLNDIRQKMNDSVTNLNTIIDQTTAGNLETFERKIFKSDTSPSNPINDMLWYDTSNPEVAVLRRYWNGEWREETVSDVEQIGGVTREKALFSELSNAFINLNIQHSKLLSEVYEVIDSEYLVDTTLKQQVQQNLDNTINVYNAIKTNLESMTPETATIGKLVDTQALFLKYRELLQTLYNSLENAKIAIDDRFKLLQSQYTDEKFNDAMSKVAEGIGGTWNAETGQLLADIPSQQELEDALKTYINGQDAALKQLIDGEVNSKITQTKNELSSNISAVSAKVDGIQVGGRNLLPTVYDYYNVSGLYGYIKVSDDNTQKVIKITDNDKTVDMSGVFFGFTKNGYDANAGVRWEHSAGSLIRNFDNDPSLKLYNYFSFFPKDKSTLDKIFKRYKIKLEKGTVATDYTQAPEDIQVNITKAQADATTASNAYADAQDALHKTEANAYADGKVTAEEQRAIKDAQAKFDAAKTYADAQDLLVKTQTKAYADGLITAEEERAIKDAQDNLAAAKAYADAQDALRKTEVQAYADGIVTEEEERAIADAQAKLTQAKAYADTTKAAALAYTDEKLEPITSTQTKQSTDIKQLQDGITLKADKTELTTMYDTNIKPLETQVNEQKSQLDILPAQINSKVSQSTYDAGVNNIVSRLNSADTQRQQLSNAINDRVTIKEYTDNKTATTNQINTAVNNVQVGGRNLLENSANIKKGINDTSNNYNQYWATLITSAHSKLQLGETITISFDVQMERGEILRVYDTLTNYDFMFGEKVFTNLGNKKQRLSFTLPLVSTTKTGTLWNLSFYNNNNGDRFTIENIKIEKGNKATDWVPAPEDVKVDIDKAKAETDKTLDVMQTQINQNGTDINARATKEEFNASRKTLSKVVSDLTVSTTTGLTLSYDENGNITSSTVGPEGIMLKGDHVDITVNEDFKVMTNTINNKVGKHEVINSINVSNEGIAIDANKVGIRGGDGTTYLDIQNTKLLSRGFFDRTWGDVTDRPYCKLGIYDGHLIMQNETSARNLYLTEKGLSTTMAGNLKGTSGTLEFHFLSPTDNTEGVRLHSYYGMVYLQSQENRVYIRSKQTTNIETADAGIYVRPYNLTRPGYNEFSYKVVEADKPEETDGYFIYGEVSNPDGLAGSGIRFRKKGYKGQTTGEYEPMIYATDNAGNANTGSFSARNFYGDLKTRLTHLYIMADSNGGEIRATSTTGYNNGNTTYLPVRAAGIKTHSSLAFTNHSDNDVFFGIMPNKTFCFTDVNGYNGGKPAYQSVRAKEYLPGSLEEYKRDIKEWNDDALTSISNAQLYQYNYKNDLADEKKRHGFVIGEDYATPDDFIDGDGVKTYEMIAYCMRAIQQLNEKLEEQINGK